MQATILPYAECVTSRMYTKIIFDTKRVVGFTSPYVSNLTYSSVLHSTGHADNMNQTQGF
jgi:hypothetical protein